MNIIDYIKGAKLANTSLFAALFISVVGIGTIIGSAVNAATSTNQPDCTNAAVVKCGFTDANDLATKYAATSDVRALYNLMGMTQQKFNQFVAGAKWATVSRDGSIVRDDGVEVLKSSQGGATVTSRVQDNQYVYGPIAAGGTSFYGGYISTGMPSEPLRALHLKISGINYVILSSNGSLLSMAPNAPIFECTELISKSLTENTYQFYTNVRLRSATVKSLTYDFGDGQTSVQTNAATKVTHEFTPGSHTVKVTVNYVVDGREYAEPLQSKCQVEVDVPEPPVVKQPVTEQPKPEETIVVASQETQKPAQTTQEVKAATTQRLPQTGPAEVFAAAIGASGLGAAGAYWRASRRTVVRSTAGKLVSK